MNKKKKFNIKPVLIFILACLGLFSIAAPFVLTRAALLECLIFNSDTSEIGDTIGGITAPFIGAAVGILTYLAFLKQSEANKLQIKALKKAKKQYNESLIQNQIKSFIEYKEKEFNRIKITETEKYGHEVGLIIFDIITLARHALIYKLNEEQILQCDNSNLDIRVNYEIGNLFPYYCAIVKNIIINIELQPLNNNSFVTIETYQQPGSQIELQAKIKNTLESLWKKNGPIHQNFINLFQNEETKEIIEKNKKVFYLLEYFNFITQYQFTPPYEKLKTDQKNIIINSFSNIEAGIIMFYFLGIITQERLQIYKNEKLVLDIIKKGTKTGTMPIEYNEIALRVIDLIENLP